MTLRRSVAFRTFCLFCTCPPGAFPTWDTDLTSFSNSSVSGPSPGSFLQMSPHVPFLTTLACPSNHPSPYQF